VQSASRFEADFHARGTGLSGSSHYWFNRRRKNDYLIDARTYLKILNEVTGNKAKNECKC